MREPVPEKKKEQVNRLRNDLCPIRNQFQRRKRTG
jgi:hypothetical protein